MTIRVFVAEDSPLLAERLVQLIEESGDMTVIGHTGALDEVLPRIDALAPDVALVDVHLEGGSAFALLPALRRRTPRPGVVLMSESDYAGYRREALARGANAFLDKAADFEHLLPVLRQAAAGMQR